MTNKFGSDLDRCSREYALVSDNLVTCTAVPCVCHANFWFWFLLLTVFEKKYLGCPPCSFRSDISWKFKSWSMAVFCVDQYLLLICLMELSSSMMKISLRFCSSKTFSLQSIRATNVSAYWNWFFLKSWKCLFPFSVLVMLSSVAYVCNKEFTTFRYVVGLELVPVEATLVLTLSFDASCVCSAKAANFVIWRWKSKIAAPSCILLESHTNVKFDKNPWTEIELNG